jgi:predicted CoA-binding protein
MESLKTESFAIARSMNVAILGASAKPERYAHIAQALLMEHEYEVFPVSPTGAEILGVAGYSSVSEITEEIETLTLYLGPDRLGPLVEEIILAKPRRVIFNPGTESADPMAAFEKAGIECEEACTLVLLRTGAF